MNTQWFKGKRVFVTGAGGFIGSHLVEQLSLSGASVHGMVHYNSRNHWGNLEYLSKDAMANVQVTLGDITDPVSVRKAMKDSEVVFHLAALIGIPYSYLAPQSYVMTNVLGTLNVMQAALDMGVKKVVHTSTSEAYGTALYTPMDEAHPLQGQSPYSASKIGGDKMAESFYLSHELPVATIRPFNTYGPRQSARAVIPTIISQVVAQKGKGTIKLGSLDPVRDLTFVLDTVAGFMAVAATKGTEGKVTNVGQGFGVSIGELAQKIIELMGADVRIIADETRVRPEKSEVLKLICKADQAKSLCHWTPKTSLDDGLRATIQFVKENIELFKPEIYTV